jgi:hypothetical protein
MNHADTNVIAAELRAGYHHIPRTAKLGYSTAITQVANALEQQLGASFDRRAFMEAATVRAPAQAPLALEVVR